MGTYVENLKKLLDDVKADMPNPPSRDTGDVIEGIFSITKTNEIEVQNPTKSVNKGEHLKKGERLKSEREKAITCAKKKICKEIYNETDFKERFDKIVWNMFIEPLTFEEKWAQLIEDFDLKKHKWLTKMFNLREIWIPAYFIDSPLFGLMRTTSRSESENSFFKSFTSPGATLVSFMMSYESAMERQRYRQEKLDFNTIDAAPKCITQLDIERHAARVYTRTMFLIVQTEINEGCWNCTIQGLNIDEGCETVIIRDKKPNENKSLFHKKRKKKEKKKRRKLKQRETIRFTTESHEIYMESQEIHIESQEISLESQMIQVESQEIHTESHEISLESHGYFLI
ncbi:FAR1-related sequence 5-like protein [Tanacetum coccineum]